MPTRFVMTRCSPVLYLVTLTGLCSQVPSFGELAQQSYVKSRYPENQAWFGSAVAMDGIRMAIAAPKDDGYRTDVGTVAVYRWQTNGTWYREERWTAPTANDQFGTAVAISGDTIVVGYPNEDSNATGIGGDQSNNSAPESGAAMVFVRNGGNWSFQAYLKSSNSEEDDLFGSSVAISGDTIVIGAPGEDGHASGANGNEGNRIGYYESGAAYIFVRTGSTWTQQAYLKASNGADGDAFGSSAAISGDTILVGAPLEDRDANGVSGPRRDSGSAYVFTRNGTNWSQQAYLKASNIGSYDRFGTCAAISGDTAVIGAPEEDGAVGGVNGDGANDSAWGSGAAYAFNRTGTSWSQQAYLKSPVPEQDDEFAGSVAIDGDTIVVGCRWEDSGARGVDGDETNNDVPNAGAAFVFTRAGSTWSQSHYLKASNSDPYDSFGSGVAVSSGVIAVGAFLEDGDSEGGNGRMDEEQNNLGSNVGAVYTFQDYANVAPQITVEHPLRNELAQGVTIDFGEESVENSATRIITIRNSGHGTLESIALNLSSPSGEFSLDTTATEIVLGAGASTTCVVSFAPTAPGLRTASLVITSNDGAGSPFPLSLAGTGQETAYSLWAAAAGLSGPDSDPLAVPFGDGVENLLKFAFNMNGAGPDHSVLVPGSGGSGLPVFTVTGSASSRVFRVEFVRRTSGDVVYHALQSTSLTTDSWVPFPGSPIIAPINSDWERVVFEQPFDPTETPVGFGVVEVAFP